jgi:transcriptional regulator with XRE-family HTH domain
MTQGERVKAVRKSLGLTLENFGAKIGLKKSGLSLIENGRNELTDGNAKAICREFNVNEDWLRTGAGGPENMFIPEDMRYLNSVGKLGNEQNEFKKFCINMLMDLPDKYWDYIYEEFKKFEKSKEEE